MNGEYLEATVRVDGGRDLAALAASIGQVRDALGALLAECAADGRRVAAWGSGAKGLTSLAEAGAQGIRYVVDSDPYKQGRLTPVTHLPVVAPEQLERDPVDVITSPRWPTATRSSSSCAGRLASAGRSLCSAPRSSCSDPGGGSAQEVEHGDQPGAAPSSWTCSRISSM